MQNVKNVKSAFWSLEVLHNQWFPTWVAKAYGLAKDYDIDIDGSVLLTTKQFTSLYYEHTTSSLVRNWNAHPLEKYRMLFELHQFTAVLHASDAIESQFSRLRNRMRALYTTQIRSNSDTAFLLPQGWGRITFYCQLPGEYQWTQIFVHKNYLQEPTIYTSW